MSSRFSSKLVAKTWNHVVCYPRWLFLLYFSENYLLSYHERHFSLCSCREFALMTFHTQTLGKHPWRLLSQKLWFPRNLQLGQGTSLMYRCCSKSCCKLGSGSLKNYRAQYKGPSKRLCIEWSHQIYLRKNCVQDDSSWWTWKHSNLWFYCCRT